MAKRTGRARSAYCPTCGAGVGKPCTTLGGKSRRPHPQRLALVKKLEGDIKPRKKSGNKGHRLAQTAAPSKEITAARARARRPQAVTVRHADGTVEVKGPGAFRKKQKAPRKPRQEGPRTYTREQSLARDAELEAWVAREAAETPPER